MDEYQEIFNSLSRPMKKALRMVYKKHGFYTQWGRKDGQHVHDNVVNALKRRGLMIAAKIPTPFNDRQYFYVDQLTLLGALVISSVMERDEV